MRPILFFILFSSFLLASVGEITGFTGSVKVIRSNKPIDATLGMRVENRDLIKTSNDSKVQMVMDDNTVITLGKNSEFVIEEVDYASVNQKAKFSALKGAFKVMTGEISKTSPKGFELRGRTSTIGIRGTFFAGEVGELTDRVACIDGAIVVTSISTGDMVNVKAGEITSVNVGEPPAPPRNYTSNELDSLSGNSNNSKENRSKAGEGEELQTLSDEDEDVEEDDVFASAAIGSEVGGYVDTATDYMDESKDEKAKEDSLNTLGQQSLHSDGSISDLDSHGTYQGFVLDPNSAGYQNSEVAAIVTQKAQDKYIGTILTLDSMVSWNTCRSSQYDQ